MFEKFFKLMLICTLCVVTLIGCEKQKQASAEVGAAPKQIMDKATTDFNNAQTLEAEQLKALENVDGSADTGK